METKNVPHLLIFAPNWVGDAVMALPAIADLRRALPDATIDIAARRSIAPLFALVRGVDDVLVLEERRATEDTIAFVRRRACDTAILLTNAFQTALIAWRAGVRERWGYRTDWRGALLTRAIMPPGAALHQAARYQHLVRALGFANGTLEPQLEASPDAKRAGLTLLTSAGWNERSPLVALAPGAAYGSAKRWPAERFAALAASLLRDGFVPVLVGGPADAAAGAELLGLSEAEKGPDAAINLIGQTDLPALAGVLAQCRSLVTNDSGAMHFAVALGVAVTAIFGPTDETATRPLGRAGARPPVIVTHDVWCRPCLLRECPLTHRCMRGISADAVARTLTQNDAPGLPHATRST